MDSSLLLTGEHSANGVSPGVILKESVITPQNTGGFEVHPNGQQGNYAIETQVFEGDYDTLAAQLAGMSIGSYIATKGTEGINVAGGVFSMNLERTNAGQGTATIVSYKFDNTSCSLHPYDQESGTPSTGNAPFAEFYSVQNARYDIPLERYLTNTLASTTNPDRIKYEAWNAEEDTELKREYQYTDGDTTATLAGLTLKFAKKIMHGQEVVLKFWPVVTRTTLWWKACYPFIAVPPEEPGSNNQRLGYICKPLSFYSLGKDWLKIQDDLTGEGPVLTRTECWMASDKWDEDLYGWGEARWKFADAEDSTTV